MYLSVLSEMDDIQFSFHHFGSIPTGLLISDLLSLRLLRLAVHDQRFFLIRFSQVTWENLKTIQLAVLEKGFSHGRVIPFRKTILEYDQEGKPILLFHVLEFFLFILWIHHSFSFRSLRTGLLLSDLLSLSSEQLTVHNQRLLIMRFSVVAWEYLKTFQFAVLRKGYPHSFICTLAYDQKRKLIFLLRVLEFLLFIPQMISSSPSTVLEVFQLVFFLVVCYLRACASS